MLKNVMHDLDDLLSEFERKHNFDVLVFNGPVRPDTSRSFRQLINQNHSGRQNVLLILSTLGGFPDDGYRIARALQRRYEKFTIYIPSLCKSTGTLLAIGASDLIMGDFGELGPLDIQMRKTDELWETSSGLNVSAALTQIENRVCESFSRFFIDMKGRFQLSTKTASEIATKLSEGIYEGIAEQIDPIQLGEANRSIGIAQHYGESLNRKSKNLKDGALARLIATYPSHSYVIDCEEASSLFNNVRTPTDKEANLFKILDVLFNLSTVVDSSQDSVIRNVREMIAVFKELQTQEEAQTANTTRLAQMQDDDSMHQQVSLTKRTLNGASNGQGDSDVNEVQCGAPIQSAVSTRRSAGQERTTSKIVKTA